MMGYTFNSHGEKTVRKTQCWPCGSGSYCFPAGLRDTAGFSVRSFPLGVGKVSWGWCFPSATLVPLSSPGLWTPAFIPPGQPAQGPGGVQPLPRAALWTMLSHRQTMGFTQVTHRCWEWHLELNFRAEVLAELHLARLPNLSCYVLVWTGLLREKMSREEILVTLLATLKARGSIQ